MPSPAPGSVRHRRYRVHARAHLLARTLRRAARPERRRSRWWTRWRPGSTSRPLRRATRGRSGREGVPRRPAGHRDLRARFGDVPKPLFDTQVAAMVAGFGDQVGYDALVASLTGGLDRQGAPVQRLVGAAALGRADRLRRRRRDLAARGLQKLRQRLEQDGRLEWVAEEMAVLADPATYRPDPEAMWERLRPRTGNRRLLGVLRAVAAWREREAQRVEHPPPAPAQGRGAAGDRRHRAGHGGGARPRAGRDARLRGGQDRAPRCSPRLPRPRRCPRARCRKRRAAGTARGPRPRSSRC